MKKNSLLWSLAAASMMFFASCENNDGPVDNKIEGEPTTVTISIATTRSTSGTEAAIGSESDINYLEAYTFDSDDKFIGYAEAEVSGSSTDKKVTVAAITGNVSVAVVVNTDPDEPIGEVNNLDELKAKLTGYEFERGKSTIANAPLPTGFVMFGLKEDYLIDDEEQELTISVRRTVSKFAEPTFKPKTGDKLLDLTGISVDDINAIFPDTEFTGDYEKLSFVYESFVLANGLDKSILFNDADYEEKGSWPVKAGWITEGSTTGKLTYLISKFITSGANEGHYQTNGVYSGAFGNEVVYVHENFPYLTTKNGKKGYLPTEVYCFIVKGHFEYEKSLVVEESEDRYWRINLVRSTVAGPDTNDLYRIFRNGSYKVNVQKITTLGYNTPKEAEEEEEIIPADATLNITVDVEKWDIYESNTQK